MPTYDEVIQQSHQNINDLGEKIQGFENLFSEIKELANNPKIFQQQRDAAVGRFEKQYHEIYRLSQDHINLLSGVTKSYLKGSDKVLSESFKYFDNNLEGLNQEISRLKNTDLDQSFSTLQKIFIEQSRKDLAIELAKFGEQAKEIENLNEGLKRELFRLENVDLVAHFAKHQKTLSEIFNAINAINSIFVNVTKNISEVHTLLTKTNKLIAENQRVLTKNQDELFKKIQLLRAENTLLEKGISMNKYIQIGGMILIIVLLLVLIFK